MSAPTGIYADPVLDGIDLVSVPVSEWVIRGSKPVTVRTAADGTGRVQITYLGDGAPISRPVRSFRLNWNQLGAMRDLVERILSDPGAHTLIVWRPEFLAYAGDGSRTSFILPWPNALDSASPPRGRSSTPLAPEIRIGVSATPLTVLTKSTSLYDAGSPSSGEAWIEEDGVRFKVSSAPASGDRLFLRYCPVYTVAEVPETEQSLRAPIREPRSLELREVLA